MTTEPTSLPLAPPEEDAKDACCPTCGSLFHRASEHIGSAAKVAFLGPAAEFPPGYDPAEADRLIGRNPDGPTAQ